MLQFLLTSHMFFRIPCALFELPFEGPLLFFRIGVASEASPVSGTTSTASVLTFSTLPKALALSACAGLSCISGLHSFCPTSSSCSIVLAWLSVPVSSELLRPIDRAIRLRREPVVAWELGSDDLKADKPGRRLEFLRRFLYMCHMMGRLVHSMPPRGSKAEYAPSGT